MQATDGKPPVTCTFRGGRDRIRTCDPYRVEVDQRDSLTCVNTRKEPATCINAVSSNVIRLHRFSTSRGLAAACEIRFVSVAPLHYREGRSRKAGSSRRPKSGTPPPDLPLMENRKGDPVMSRRPP